ncbi:hypothetical protein ACH495_25500 [Micromonospora sp. NPDC018662]|uniref:hypothetical protein n=1 Tax=Micromonospora sp. NPDC018662 TaxID=3364238 RepID=UPI003798757A
MKRSAAAVMAVALGLSTIAVAGPAWAEPPGCSHVKPDIYEESPGYMTAYGSGSCSASETRTFRVEIKKDLSGRPDPVLSSYDDRHTGMSYYAETSSCDGGANATYYGRTFFTSSPTYKDSDHLDVNTC